MIVRLDPQQMQAIDRRADWKHDRFWSAVRDSLEHHRNDRWLVVPGDGNEIAEEVLDAWFEAQEEGEANPYSTINDVDVQTVGSQIFDHMNYGLAYGFDDDDDDDDDDDEYDLETSAVMTPSGRLGSRVSASLDGKFIGEFRDEDEAIEALREAAGPNYFPDLLWVDDHGGIAARDWD